MIRLSYNGRDPRAAIDKEDRAVRPPRPKGEGGAAVSLSAIRFDNELIESDGNILLTMMSAFGVQVSAVEKGRSLCGLEFLNKSYGVEADYFCNL
jgi:hypothetical protein